MPAQSQEAQQFSEHSELRNRRATDLLKHTNMTTGLNRDGELSRVIAVKQRRKIGWQCLKDHPGTGGAPLMTEIK
jgi:hypothetical protein